MTRRLHLRCSLTETKSSTVSSGFTLGELVFFVAAVGCNRPEKAIFFTFRARGFRKCMNLHFTRNHYNRSERRGVSPDILGVPCGRSLRCRLQRVYDDTSAEPALPEASGSKNVAESCAQYSRKCCHHILGDGSDDRRSSSTHTSSFQHITFTLYSTGLKAPLNFAISHKPSFRPVTQALLLLVSTILTLPHSLDWTLRAPSSRSFTV